MIDKDKIEKAFNNYELLNELEYKKSVNDTINLLDMGELRVVYKEGDEWHVNEWVKKAVILYFVLRKSEPVELGIFNYNDKVKLKKNYDKLGVRVVPGAIARYGSYLSKGVILMPSFVNIGAYVGNNTMIDTWATVGSCAYIGDNVHIAGGVGIGGVLEPPQARPVIIEDNCFIGSRSIIVEGVRVCREAVIGANVVITKSTRIVDVTKKEYTEYRGYVPPMSVVIPGSFKKVYPGGEYYVNCAMIVGKRKESTDKKVSLNDALREYGIE